jgi:tRNA(Ile)-lysidine synthase
MVVNDIVSSLDGISGKQFLSPNYRLVRDRDSLILSPIVYEAHKPCYLEEGTKEIRLPVHLRISEIEKNENFKITDSLNVACIDHDKLQFPLMIRKWQSGDYFRPLGMNGLKKISDFFIDSKMSLPEKENTWILANGEQVVWIIGRRLDDRFKITSTTRNILKLEMFK